MPRQSLQDVLRDSLDADRGGDEDFLLDAVDGEAARLAEATADALLSQHHRREEATAFDGLPRFVHFRPNSQEFDGVVTSHRAFIHAQLTRFPSHVRKTRISIHHGETHAGHSFLIERQWTDGTCRADLSTVAATRIAARPVGRELRGPKTIQSKLQSQRLNRVVGTRAKALAAPDAADAAGQKLGFGNTARWTHGWQ